MKTAAFLLDIEGTTTPIDFVAKTLFPYASAHVNEFLDIHPCEEDLKLLRAEHSRDELAISWEEGESPVPYLQQLIERDVKSSALKSIQGKLWQKGYENGEIKATIYPDVEPAIDSWRAAGLKVYIYSSGSVLAQKLLFGHLETGSILEKLDGFFDTAVGAKHDRESYLGISRQIQLEPEAIHFLSDRDVEIEAARSAGCKATLIEREKQDTDFRNIEY